MGGTSTMADCCETMATTTFTDDASRVEACYTSSVLSDDYGVRLQTIPDFLSKPWLHSTTSWTTAHTKSTALVEVAGGATLFANSYWASKLEGFNLVRGTLCIRVQINANPFQQGKLLAHFLPCLSDIDALDKSYKAMHNSCIAAKRQQPSLEIDCRDSVGVIKIPYIAPTNWYSLGNAAYDWGSLYVSVLGVLESGSGGETSVDITTYVYFEDFELSAPLVTQSKGVPKKKFKAKSVSRDNASKELEEMQNKPISSALKITASAASTLSMIPILAPIATPVAWAADVAASIASALGWSKPLNNTTMMNVSQQYNRYSATCDGPDSSYPLSLRSDNKIAVSDQLSVYDEDEMSWNFLKKVSTCISTIDWNTSQVSTTSLLNMPISPSTIYEEGTSTIGTHTTTWRCGPPAYYLSKQFGFYRGSIDITIKIVKTDFHCGRLQLTWTPTDNFTTSPTLTTAVIALREIIDLREGNEFKFNLKYLIESNYLPMYQTMGNLDILVLNELRGPETVSPAVQLLLYVSGGDDLEFAAPGWNGITDSRVGLPFSPQTGGDEEVVNEGVGKEPIMSFQNEFAQQSQGEMFMSLKQLLNRNSQLSIVTWPSSATTLAYWPWSQAVLYQAATTGTLSGSLVGGTVYDIFAPLYAFFRGSARVVMQTAYSDVSNQGRNNSVTAYLQMKDVLQTTANVPVIDIGNTLEGAQSQINWVSSSSISGCQGYALSNAGVGLVSVTVPYHCRTKCSLNLRQTVVSDIPLDKSQPIPQVQFKSIQGFSSFAAYRSFSDEFQLSYFVGCPPVYISST